MLHRGDADTFLDLIAAPLDQFSDDGWIVRVCPKNGGQVIVREPRRGHHVGLGDLDTPHPAAGVLAYVLAQLNRKSVVTFHRSSRFETSRWATAGVFLNQWQIIRFGSVL